VTEQIFDAEVRDPALGFWLRHVAAVGGLWEPAGDTAYVVLPQPLRDTYGLPEELHVTADPDIARDDGVTLLAPGHPVLGQAAERVLASGDAGHLVLARPASVPPGRDVLLAEVRDAFPVDHGRIDLAGEPEVVLHPVIRVGALVTYELSAEDRFQEQTERWVDVPASRDLPPGLIDRLTRAEVDERSVPSERPESLLPAISEAHRLIDSAATSRREALGGQVGSAHEAERARATAYYAEAITGIERRLATAPADRKALLEQRLRSTREEKTRRLAEIAEKYEARHVVRPYRLHVIGVPALRVPADVRRGDRRYPFSFDWLLPAGRYAPVRCPSCGGGAPLVAGKQKLGCETCLAPRSQPSEPSEQPTRAPATSASLDAAPGAPRPEPTERTAAAPESAAKRTPPVPAGKRQPAVPPAVKKARQQPAVPPTVKKARRKAIGQLAEQLWSSIAADDYRAAREFVHPGSPAAALCQVLGPPGLTRVIGMPPGEQPVRFTAQLVDEADGDALVGVLLGTAATECTYYIYCRDGRAAEVLPFPVYPDARFWTSYWWGRRPGATWATGRIAVPTGLDPVESSLISKGPAWSGLPVVARALAAWARIADDHDRLRAAHQPPALAGAVHRLVAYRAGGRATFGDAATPYRVPELAVRQADRVVRPLLALGPAQAW
jgi:hypothetical protein